MYYLGIQVNISKYLHLYDKSPICDYEFLENRQYIVLASPILPYMSSKCGMNVIYG